MVVNYHRRNEMERELSEDEIPILPLDRTARGNSRFILMMISFNRVYYGDRAPKFCSTSEVGGQYPLWNIGAGHPYTSATMQRCKRKVDIVFDIITMTSNSQTSCPIS